MAGDSRHRVELTGGQDATGKAAIYPRVECESGAEVSVSPITGGLIWGDAGAATQPNLMSGPVLVDCATHGSYLGFAHVLLRGSNFGVGESPVSMPLMLVRLQDIEWVLPESMK